MLKDVTLGQYYPSNSIIHRLDPRVKLFGTLLYLVTLFLAKNPIVYGLCGVFLAVCICISRVPLKFMVKGLRSIAIILAISLVFTYFNEGLEQTVYMALRMVMLILGASIMTLTTTPTRLADGLEKALGFLNKVRFPVHELAMIISIALRFIPILMEEADMIMKAQTARGADFTHGNIFMRIRAIVPIIVPLFVSAIKRAGDLANAMEARCYHGGEGRTKMMPLKYAKRDAFAYLILFTYLALIICGKIFWKKFF